MITFIIASYNCITCGSRPSCERETLLNLYRPADKDTYYHANVYLEPVQARRLHQKLSGNIHSRDINRKCV